MKRLVIAVLVIGVAESYVASGAYVRPASAGPRAHRWQSPPSMQWA
jgi:hypothetical protein